MSLMSSSTGFKRSVTQILKTIDLFRDGCVWNLPAELLVPGDGIEFKIGKAFIAIGGY